MVPLPSKKKDTTFLRYYSFQKLIPSHIVVRGKPIWVQTIIVYANVNKCKSGSATMGAAWRLIVFKNIVLLRLFKCNRYDQKFSLYKVNKICIEVEKCTHGITFLHIPLVSFIFIPGRLVVKLYLSFIPLNIKQVTIKMRTNAHNSTHSDVYCCPTLPLEWVDKLVQLLNAKFNENPFSNV